MSELEEKIFEKRSVPVQNLPKVRERRYSIVKNNLCHLSLVPVTAKHPLVPEMEKSWERWQRQASVGPYTAPSRSTGEPRVRMEGRQDDEGETDDGLAKGLTNGGVLMEGEARSAG